MAEQPKIVVETDESAVIVAFRGTDLDYETSGALRTQAIAAAKENSNLPLIVDLGNVGMLPSESIGALIMVSQVARDAGQRFMLAGLNENVRMTLMACRLDRLFEMHSTREDALAAL